MSFILICICVTFILYVIQTLFYNYLSNAKWAQVHMDQFCLHQQKAVLYSYLQSTIGSWARACWAQSEIDEDIFIIIDFHGYDLLACWLHWWMQMLYQVVFQLNVLRNAAFGYDLNVQSLFLQLRPHFFIWWITLKIGISGEKKGGKRIWRSSNEKCTLWASTNAIEAL